MSEHAIPFAIGLTLTVLGLISGEFVRARCGEHARSIGQNEDGVVVAYAVWAADAAQMLVIALTPLVSAIALLHWSNELVGVCYLVATVVGVGCFRWVLFQQPDRYASMSIVRIAPVPAFGIGLNVVLGLVAGLVL